MREEPWRDVLINTVGFVLFVVVLIGWLSTN